VYFAVAVALYIVLTQRQLNHKPNKLQLISTCRLLSLQHFAMSISYRNISNTSFYERHGRCASLLCHPAGLGLLEKYKVVKTREERDPVPDKEFASRRALHMRFNLSLEKRNQKFLLLCASVSKNNGVIRTRKTGLCPGKTTRQCMVNSAELKRPANPMT